MKFFKRFIFIGFAVLCFSSLIFLFLSKSSRLKLQQSNNGFQRIKTHSYPDDTHDRQTHKQEITGNEGTGQNSNAQEENTVENLSQGLYDALKPARELWETDPELATVKLHEITKELGSGDPKWTEFYHLLGHSIVERPPGAPDGAFLTLEDAKRYYLLKNELIGLSKDDKKYVKELQLSLRWNQEGKQVGQQTQPIRDLLAWMKENAPTEWETVNTHFWEKLPSRNAPPILFSESKWRTVGERVDIQYDTFFEALDQLPENSLTLQVLYGNSMNLAQETLSSEQTNLESLPVPTNTTETSTHTWDMVHEAPVRIDEISPESMRNSPPPPAALASDSQIDFQTQDFELEVPTTERLQTALEGQFSPERSRRAMSTLTQYGTKEGLRRLKNDDPELASHIEKHFQRQNPPLSH